MRRLLVWISLAVTTGCGFPTGDSWEVSLIVTGTSTTQDPPGKLVTFVAVNRSNAALWVPRCGESIAVAIDRLEQQWVQYAGALCPANLRQDPMRLEAGEQITSTKQISGTGLFRLHTGQTRDPQAEMTWNVVSDPIQID